jgi:hypothetical protein
MSEKLFTAKQAASAVLEKVGEILQKSELHKKSEGHFSMSAAPEEPEAGRASHPSKCPECGHPSPESGQGDTLPRSKAQEDWQKSEKDSKIRQLQKHGLSPEQIKIRLKKEEKDMEKHGLSPAEMKAKMAKKEKDLEKHGLGPAEMKAKMAKGEAENSKKLGYKLSEAGKEERQPEASDNAFKVKGEKEDKSSHDERQAEQKDPQHNAAEQKEGNNELAGTTPTEVGQDGKNKPGYDEMKGHLKLAKFIGMKHYKRSKALEGSQSQSSAEAQHEESIKNK